MSWLRERARRRQEAGRYAEQAAADFLRAEGYAVEATNVRYPVGEIDIVARESGVLCFVEVRSVSSAFWGGAAATVSSAKRRKLIRAARWFLQRNTDVPDQVRFDVVTVEALPGALARIELIRSAFTADEGDRGGW